jgi:hypothetical protein
VRQLNREATDTTGGAGDRYATALERVAEGERAHRREPRDRERRGDLERHLVRDLGQVVRANGNALGPPASVRPSDHVDAGVDDRALPMPLGRRLGDHDRRRPIQGASRRTRSAARRTRHG